MYIFPESVLPVDTSCQISYFCINQKYHINFDSINSVEICIFAYIKGHIFFIMAIRFFTENYGGVDLGIWFEFQLDISKRS